MVMPLGGGLVLGWFVPDSIAGEHRTLLAAFLGVALSISALPVIAKTLLDLGLFKTDVGLLVMTVAMVNDLVGWIAFSVLLGPMRGGGIELGPLARTIAFAVIFVVGCLVAGRSIVDRLFARLEQQA